jgi:hypothetical protein
MSCDTLISMSRDVLSRGHARMALHGCGRQLVGPGCRGGVAPRRGPGCRGGVAAGRRRHAASRHCQAGRHRQAQAGAGRRRQAQTGAGRPVCCVAAGRRVRQAADSVWKASGGVQGTNAPYGVRVRGRSSRRTRSRIRLSVSLRVSLASPRWRQRLFLFPSVSLSLCASDPCLPAYLCGRL